MDIAISCGGAEPGESRGRGKLCGGYRRALVGDVEVIGARNGQADGAPEVPVEVPPAGQWFDAEALTPL